jgi:hypothetical protein
METTLKTAAGEYVATIWIPPFKPPAGVVIWGQRIFTRYEAGEYREAFAYRCPPDASTSAPIAPAISSAVPPSAPSAAKGFDNEAT